VYSISSYAYVHVLFVISYLFAQHTVVDISDVR